MLAYHRFFPHLRVLPTSAPRPVDLFVVEIKLHFLSLHRKDPSAFFSFPVTDFIAPGYSMIIKHPMDFSTGKEKIKNNDYQWMEELKDSLQLMCTNAMLYNKPETIYYKAAKKLLCSGMKILSGENSAHRLHGRLAEESKAERQNRHLTEQGRWWLLASRKGGL